MAKKRDDEGMKSRLMEAAMSAFSKKGLEGCTMGDIADEAGLARGTAYLYFQGKEQLMLLMYQHYTSGLLKYQKRILAQSQERSARRLIQQMCEECLKAAMSHRKTFRLWFQFLAMSSSPKLRTKIQKILAENYRGHSDYIEDLLRRGVEQKEFRADTNQRAVAAALISLLEGMMVRDYADPTLVDLEKDYLQMVELILDGIGVQRI